MPNIELNVLILTFIVHLKSKLYSIHLLSEEKENEMGQFHFDNKNKILENLQGCCCNIKEGKQW